MITKFFKTEVGIISNDCKHATPPEAVSVKCSTEIEWFIFNKKCEIIKNLFKIVMIRY